MKLVHEMKDRAAAWRLPVRIPVPNRDNLIAMGLVALSLGLMVGVAIGPALGAASNAVAGVIAPAGPPAASEPTLDSTSSEVQLGSPAGSDSGNSTTVADTSGSPGDGDSAATSDSSYTDPEYPSEEAPVEESPAKDETPPDEPDDAEEPPPGIELKGAVLAVDPAGTGYDIADSSGNVLALHATKPPAAGDKVVTRVDPLANGTFAEVAKRKAAGRAVQSKLRGTVTWLDPEAKVAVLSSRGSSLAVDIAAVTESETPVQVGSPVEAVVSIGAPIVPEDGSSTRSGLVAKKFEVSGEPLETLDLNGVISAIGGGSSGRQLIVAADGDGVTSGQIVVEAPKNLDPSIITLGKVHNLSVTRDAKGVLNLTGLSPDYSKKVAGDPAAAFGSHA